MISPRPTLSRRPTVAEDPSYPDSEPTVVRPFHAIMRPSLKSAPLPSNCGKASIEEQPAFLVDVSDDEVASLFATLGPRSAGDTMRPVTVESEILVPTADEIIAHMMRVRTLRLAASGGVVSRSRPWAQLIIGAAFFAGLVVAATTVPGRSLVSAGAALVSARTSAVSVAVTPAPEPPATVVPHETTPAVAPAALPSTLVLSSTTAAPNAKLKSKPLAPKAATRAKK